MQEYEVIEFKPRDFKDANGNYWCDAAFLGVSEPVTWVVKDPTKFHVGDKVRGEIKDVTSKAGKAYLRFYKESQPPTQSQDSQQDTSITQSAKKEWQPRDDNAIKAQWAINQSREYIQHMLGKDAKLTEILDTAKLFYKMIEQVKNSDTTSEAPKSGIEQARAKANELRTTPGETKTTSTQPDDAEFQSLIGTTIGKTLDDDEPINLSDIPF